MTGCIQKHDGWNLTSIFSFSLMSSCSTLTRSILPLLFTSCRLLPPFLCSFAFLLLSWKTQIPHLNTGRSSHQTKTRRASNSVNDWVWWMTEGLTELKRSLRKQHLNKSSKTWADRRAALLSDFSPESGGSKDPESILDQAADKNNSDQTHPCGL